METIFNIFTICNDGVIEHIGFKTHELEGTDEEKIEFLQKNVQKDSSNLKYVKIPESFKFTQGDTEIIGAITIESYNTLNHNGTLSILFEPIFQIYNVSQTPLFVVTFVVDGEIKIEGFDELNSNPTVPFTHSLDERIPIDYINNYFTDKGFEMDRLLEDDFIKAIKILFQNDCYVSALKLLLSAIDTFSFLEYGDIVGNFKKWIDEYCEIEKANITSEELWEFRNSLLHMTNAMSRKVKRKTVKKLNFYVSYSDVEERKSDGEARFFNLKTLITIVTNGLEKWGLSFNENRYKFPVFVERYDQVISDSRYGKLYYGK
jgi:hypothetical protein